MTRYLQLPRNHRTLLDAKWFEMLHLLDWSLDASKGRLYAFRIVNVNGQRVRESMHRVIMDAQQGEEIDHINGDGLDNRESNLRFCTHQENGRNTKKYRNSTSIYKGVSWHQSSGRWQVQIKVDGRQNYLGIFPTQDAAALVYNEAAIRLFGRFANLNNIKMGLAPGKGNNADDQEALPCRDCEGSGEVFVKRDRQGRVDYLSGRVFNNETTRCDRCKGEGVEP